MILQVMGPVADKFSLQKINPDIVVNLMDTPYLCADFSK